MGVWIHGWYQVAFEQEVSSNLSSWSIGKRRLMLVTRAGRIHAYDGNCPHRGANLAQAECLRDESVICSFHGYSVGLGQSSKLKLKVREYECMTAGGMVLLRLSDRCDNGFSSFIQHLLEHHVLITGFTMRVCAPMELVIENGFDRAHFEAVHGVRVGNLQVSVSELGELRVESEFSVPPVGAYKAQVGDYCELGYLARVFSPGLAAVTLGGSKPYTIITGATDLGDGTCAIRITLALPSLHFGENPAEEQYRYILEHSKRGLEQDRQIWESLAVNHPVQWMPDDEPVHRFHEFCTNHHSEGNVWR